MIVSFGLCVGSPARAEEDWLSRSHVILDAVEQQPRPAWLDGNPETRAAAQGQATDTLRSAQKVPPFTGISASSVDAHADKKTFVIYASTSLGEAGLLDILEEASSRDDVLVVFRGMKPGQTVQAFIREVHALAKRFDEHKQPHIAIDPTRFRTAGVTVAPTLTLEENARVLAKV